VKVQPVEAADLFELRRQLHRQPVQVGRGNVQGQRFTQPADVVSVDHMNPPSIPVAAPVINAARPVNAAIGTAMLGRA